MSTPEYLFIDRFSGEVRDDDAFLNLDPSKLYDTLNVELARDLRSIRARRALTEGDSVTLSYYHQFCDKALVVRESSHDIVMFPVYEETGGYTGDLRLYYTDYSTNALALHHAEADRLIGITNPKRDEWTVSYSYLVDMEVFDGYVYLAMMHNYLYRYSLSSKTFSVISGIYGAFVEEFKNYLFLFFTGSAPGYRDALIFSALGDPTTWPAANKIIVGENGEPIIGARKFRNYILIFKPDSLYLLSGTDEDTFSIIPLTKNFGLAHPLTIYSNDSGIYFVSNTGYLYLFDGSALKRLSDQRITNVDSRYISGFVDEDSDMYYVFEYEDVSGGDFSSNNVAVNIKTGDLFHYNFKYDMGNPDGYYSMVGFNLGELQQFYSGYSSADGDYGAHVATFVHDTSGYYFKLYHKKSGDDQYAYQVDVSTPQLLRGTAMRKKFKRIYVDGRFDVSKINGRYSIDEWATWESFTLGGASVQDFIGWRTIPNPVANEISLRMYRYGNTDFILRRLGLEYVNIRRNIT